MAVQFPVTLTRSMLYRAAARQIFHPWLPLAIAFIGSVSVLATQWMREEFTWVWLLGGVWGILLGVYALAWWQAIRAANYWLSKQGDNPVLYELSDFGVKGTSQLGSFELKWDVFERLTIDDHLTLLHYPQRGRTTLPTDQVPAEAVEMLIDNFLLHGKQVQDTRQIP